MVKMVMEAMEVGVEHGVGPWELELTQEQGREEGGAGSSWSFHGTLRADQTRPGVKENRQRSREICRRFFSPPSASL